MAPQPTVGLVGSRNIDQGLQSSNKMTVTEFAFPSASRTPQQISIPNEGSTGYNGPKGGDCYADSSESTHMLSMFMLLVAGMIGTLCIGYVQ